VCYYLGGCDSWVEWVSLLPIGKYQKLGAPILITLLPFLIISIMCHTCALLDTCVNVWLLESSTVSCSVMWQIGKSSFCTPIVLDSFHPDSSEDQFWCLQIKHVVLCHHLKGTHILMDSSCVITSLGKLTLLSHASWGKLKFSGR